MKTTSKKETSKTKKQKIERASNSPTVVVQTELQCSEAVGIRKNEPSFLLRKIWRQVFDQHPSNVHDAAPTLFKTLGNSSTIGQLAGLAASGIRASLIGSGDEIPVTFNSLSSAPFVIHWFLPSGKLIPAPNMFQLVARTPQEAADFSLIVHYIAEKSLCPGIVIHSQDPEADQDQKLDMLDVEKIRLFLGLPDDEIETPSEIQKKYFGDKRNRIPDCSGTREQIKTDDLAYELPSFINEALDKFAALTGRSYSAIEQAKADVADVVIVATGRNHDWIAENLARLNKNVNAKIGLIHPTVVFPFPEDEVSRLLKGKKKVVLVSNYSSPENDPVFARLNQITRFVAFSVITGQINFEKLQSSLKETIDAGSRKSRFDISAQKEELSSGQSPKLEGEKTKTKEKSIDAKELVIKEESPEEAGTEIPSGDNFRQLLSYYITGEVTDPELQKNLGLNLKPAYLSKSRNDLNKNFPVCLSRNNSEHLVRPVSKMIDEIISNEAKSEDENDSLKSNLSLLKIKLEPLVNGKKVERLGELWDKATASILSEIKTDNGIKEQAKKDFQKARTKIPVDGEVLARDAGFHLRVIDESLRAVWAEKTIYFGDLLELLITQLMGLSGTGLSQKDNEVDFGSSVASAFKDELDFKSFSNIVDEAFESKPLPKVKQLRIRSALKDLQEFRQLYTDFGKGGLFEFNCDATNCAITIGQVQARIHKTTKFFRALHIARLEVENKYKAEKHDGFFNGYSTNHLTAEDLEVTPPILLFFHSKFMDETQLASITEILKTDLPVKVILLNNDVIDESDLLADQPTWSTKFASMAIGLNNVYVFQSAVTDGEQLATGIAIGLRYNGPALFNFYVGPDENHSSLPLEILSSMASESRAFPTLIYDPSKSRDWGLRFNIHDNPQFENDWVSEKLSYQDSGGNDASIDLAFTFVDFLASDPRFTDHFLYLPRKRWHENMVPVQDYLKLKLEDSKYKIPYLLMTREDGTLCRVIPSSFVVRMAMSWLDIWRSLQEVGLFKEERARLEEERRKGIEEVEQKYQKESGKSESELKKQIITNLLTRLLSGDLKSPIDVSAPAAQMVSTPMPGTEVAEKPVEVIPEKKEEVSEIVDPYIDTRLCTSCNECTNINSRMFAYNENKQAYIKDAKAGTFKELVKAAEKCPARIIHPGKPKNPSEPGLDKLIKRAEQFNK